MRSNFLFPSALVCVVVSVGHAWVAPTSTPPSILPRIHRSIRSHEVRRYQSSRALDEFQDISTTTESSLDPSTAPEFSMAQVGINPSQSTAREFTSFQQFARIAPLATLAFYAINPEPLDHFVSNLYDWIYSWDVTHTRLFEAHVAVFSFFVSIASFSMIHLFLKEDQVKKYHLDGKLPTIDPMEWATKEGWQLWFNPVVAYLVSIWIYQQVLGTYHAPPVLAPTFGVLVGEVLFGVFLYDLFFAPVHIFFHRGPLKDLRAVHGYHHRHTQGSLNSIETVQHSYLDGSAQVLCNILVQHISPFGGPKHLLSRVLHNIIVTYMLAEAHSGYNFEWQTHNIWPEFLGGAPRHDRHHKDGRVYYQQFFMYLDNALGFTDEAVQEELQKKVDAKSKNNKNVDNIVSDENIRPQLQKDKQSASAEKKETATAA